MVLLGFCGGFGWGLFGVLARVFLEFCGVVGGRGGGNGFYSDHLEVVNKSERRGGPVSCLVAGAFCLNNYNTNWAHL